MANEQLVNSIQAILPEHDDDLHEAYEHAIEEEIAQEQESLIAADLARIRAREKSALKRRKNKEDKESIQIAQNLAELDVLKDSPSAQRFLAGGENDITPYAGTTRKDVVKLLTSLNINTSLYLTQADTYNLLSCLLTCNEAQLDAIANNKKVPLVIKTVIKRLKDDARVGAIDTIERLWDRIFGKNQVAATLHMPEGVTPGLLPNTLVSREAYMIIRDTIIGPQN